VPILFINVIHIDWVLYKCIVQLAEKQQEQGRWKRIDSLLFYRFPACAKCKSTISLDASDLRSPM